MSKTWKWILGIFLVLLIVGAFFAMGFAHTRSVAFISSDGGAFERNWNGPMMGQAPNGWEHPRVMQRNDGWGQPMMLERGFAPYHSGFSAFGGLVHVALFFGLLYGAYWLGRRNARIVLDPAPAAPVAEVPSSEAESADPMPEAEPVPVTPKRGKKIA